METTSLGWCGTRTDRSRELAHFYEHVLGLRLVHTETDFWVFELPDGRHVEVFGGSYPGKEHFTTGPVAGFAVSDLPTAVSELRSAGVELLGEPGPTWQHFRGPDGNVYELVASERKTRRERLKAWIKKREGSKLYKAADPPADWIKAVAQMLIGVATVVTIAVLVWIPHFNSIGIAELGLRIVAIGLALAAVVELTYTLFTEGPDEALNPLILGLSSFVLIKISAPETKLTVSNTGAIALLILALGALFVIREIFIENHKRRRDHTASVNSPGSD